MNPCLGHHQKWTIILILIILVGCTHGQTGFRCYTCVSQENDMVCLNSPEKVGGGLGSTPCDKEDGSGFGWCTIRRVEYTATPGSVQSFVRNCEKNQPAIEDQVFTDSQFTTFYRTCRSHLCNTGDGVESLDNSNDVGDGPGGSNRKPIIVPAESSALPNLPSILMTCLILAVALIHFP